MNTTTSTISATVMVINMRGIPMPDEFILRVVLAALGVALAAAPLGCFVLWRRMVYFGDTVSHAALLGVALALVLSLPVVLGVMLTALIVAAIILTAESRLHHVDTLLGVAAHSALALGLVAVALLGGAEVDLMRYLLGDILSVGWDDVAVIWGGAVLCLGLLAWRWRRLLIASLDRDLALARGLKPRREAAIFTLALAVLVAVAIKVVGALLITALLIIPAAAARPLAGTPERMALLALLAAAASALLGLFMSFRLDTPAGPSIVVAALLVLVLSALGYRLSRRPR